MTKNDGQTDAGVGESAFGAFAFALDWNLLRFGFRYAILEENKC